jgi:hypothetical protein
MSRYQLHFAAVLSTFHSEEGDAYGIVLWGKKKISASLATFAKKNGYL